MSWLKSHRFALITIPVAAAGLAITLWFYSIVANADPPMLDERAEAGELVEFGGYRFDNFELEEIDASDIVPAGAVLYELRVDYEPATKKLEDLVCSTVSLVEVDGERREIAVLNNMDMLLSLDALTADCIGDFSYEPGSSIVYFVVPDDIGTVEVIMGYPFGDNMTVALPD